MTREQIRLIENCYQALGIFSLLDSSNNSIDEVLKLIKAQIHNEKDIASLSHFLKDFNDLIFNLLYNKNQNSYEIIYTQINTFLKRASF